MTIELRLTEVDPPTAEPERTIYRDIVNLPDPTTLGITIRYFNYDDVNLYMQITGSATGYTFTPVNLGLLASGTNAYKNLDNFASRAKPTVGQLPNGEMSENITLILKGYTDAGYTTLKWTFDRIVTVIWINSADAAFSVDFLNNFDDGTVQGWAELMESGGGNGTFAVSIDYVLSTPYALRRTNDYNVEHFIDRIYKSFTTPNKNAVYAIFDIRLSRPASFWHPTYGWLGVWLKNLVIKSSSNTLVYLGKPYDTYRSENGANYVPLNKWIRIVAPITKNTSVELRIVLECYGYVVQPPGYRIWLDDFKIISK